MKKIKFPENLRKLRKEKGLSQGELAKILGYKGSNSISNLESGKSTPDLDTLCNIADYFKIDLHWLITGDDPFKRALETLCRFDMKAFYEKYAEQYNWAWRTELELRSKRERGEPLTKQESQDLKKAQEAMEDLHSLLMQFHNFGLIQEQSAMMLKNLASSAIQELALKRRSNTP